MTLMNLQRAQAQKSRSSGQSLVEFAIVFPALICLTLGIIQTALLFHAYHIVTYASYCAARSGIVHNGDLEVMKKAAAIAVRPIAGGNASLTKVSAKKSGGELTATVTQHYRLIVPAANILLGSPHIPIVASSTLPMEH